MNTQLTPRALDVIADSGETGELPLRNEETPPAAGAIDAREQEAKCRRCAMLGRDSDPEGRPRCTYCGIAYPDGQAPAAAGAALAVDEEATQPFFDLAWKHGARQHVSFAGDELEELSFRPKEFEAFCLALAATPAPEAYRVFMDGDKWCAVGPDFVDLQQSLAGFADTAYLALERLTELEGEEKRRAYRAAQPIEREDGK